MPLPLSWNSTIPIETRYDFNSFRNESHFSIMCARGTALDNALSLFELSSVRVKFAFNAVLNVYLVEVSI